MRTKYILITIVLAAAAFLASAQTGDTDGDGMPDWWENLYACVDANVVDDADDPDLDTMFNLDEYLMAMNPCEADTDGGGVTDDQEIMNDTDPLYCGDDYLNGGTGEDTDGDGWPSNCGGGILDCDDTDQTVYPGGPEICGDSKDNDCANGVDDGCSDDLDGDTVTVGGGDCDDDNDQRYPGNPEICDGIDNDCDNIVDNVNGDDVDGDGLGHCQGDCDDTVGGILGGCYHVVDRFDPVTDIQDSPVGDNEQDIEGGENVSFHLYLQNRAIASDLGSSSATLSSLGSSAGVSSVTHHYPLIPGGVAGDWYNIDKTDETTDHFFEASFTQDNGCNAQIPFKLDVETDDGKRHLDLPFTMLMGAPISGWYGDIPQRLTDNSINSQFISMAWNTNSDDSGGIAWIEDEKVKFQIIDADGRFAYETPCELSDGTNKVSSDVNVVFAPNNSVYCVYWRGTPDGGTSNSCIYTATVDDVGNPIFYETLMYGSVSSNFLGEVDIDYSPVSQYIGVIWSDKISGVRQVLFNRWDVWASNGLASPVQLTAEIADVGVPHIAASHTADEFGVSYSRAGVQFMLIDSTGTIGFGPSEMISSSATHELESWYSDSDSGYCFSWISMNAVGADIMFNANDSSDPGTMVLASDMMVSDDSSLWNDNIDMIYVPERKAAAVVWDAENDIYLQEILHGGGTPEWEKSGENNVIPFGYANSWRPEVVYDAGNYYLVAWETERHGQDRYEIYSSQMFPLTKNTFLRSSIYQDLQVTDFSLYYSPSDANNHMIEANGYFYALWQFGPMNEYYLTVIDEEASVVIDSFPLLNRSSATNPYMVEADDGLAVVWEDNSYYGGSDVLMFQKFNYDGTPKDTVKRITHESGMMFNAVNPFMRYNGSGFDVIFTEDNGNKTYHVNLDIDGNPITPYKEVGLTQVPKPNTYSVAFDDDRYAVFYYNENFSSPAMAVDMFDYSDSLINSWIHYPVDDQGDTKMDIASSGDHFYIVWREYSFGTSLYKHYHAILDKNGNPFVDPIQITEEVEQSTAPSVAWNGNIFVTTWSQKAYIAGIETPYTRYYMISDLSGYSPFDESYGTKNIFKRLFSADTFNVDDYGGVIATNGKKFGVLSLENRTGWTNEYFTLLELPEVSSCSVYNTAPAAVAGSNDADGTYHTDYGCTLNCLTLDASGSSDSDNGGGIDRCDWDLNNDGTWDKTTYPVGAEPATWQVDLSGDELSNYGIQLPGDYAVVLRVEDQFGLSDTDTGTIRVVDGTPPSVTVNAPNGGESWPAGTSHTVTWDSSDDYQVDHADVYYCTDWNGTTGTWQPVQSGVTGNSLSWNVPDTVSATCRMRVVVTDSYGNTAEDISDSNFYIVQATTSGIRTLIITYLPRVENLWPGTSGSLDTKLQELAGNSKVSGVILRLENVPAVVTAYGNWDADTTNQTLANAVASEIHTYLYNQLLNVYTKAEYIVIVGDDRIIPHYRIPDSCSIYSEDQYTPEVNCSGTAGSAICDNYFLTDNYYADLESEDTDAGQNVIHLPDYGIGRLVETPSQIEETVNIFIAQDGQVDLTNVFVSGYDFLTDGSTHIRNEWQNAGETVDSLLGQSWDEVDLETQLFTAPHTLNCLGSHDNHYSFGSPANPLPAATMDANPNSLTGSLFYNIGCHSALNVPSGDPNDLDVVEVMMKKGVAAYVGNTGFGWGLRNGKGLSEKLNMMITESLISMNEAPLGKALKVAKRRYFLEDHRYDVFDEKILQESTLFGLPMYQVIVDPVEMIENPVSGRLKGIRENIKEIPEENLPAGVTALELNFEFGTGTHVKVTTPDGEYYELNGESSGEVGDAIQPLFIYDSKLSGTVAHGTLFTGGEYTDETGFNPVVGVPVSNNTDNGEGPLPQNMTFNPIVKGGNEGVNTDCLSSDDHYDNLTVHTGYYLGGGVERLFDKMNFMVYYSNDCDTTEPAITDPGGGDLHTLDGLTAGFSVDVSDASGVFRVLITYTADQGVWDSLDLSYNGTSGSWEGSLEVRRDTKYIVQAVDNAGNAAVLDVTGNDLDALSQPYGSEYSAARSFTIDLADTDGDGMPDVWENDNGLDAGTDDSGLDPDNDGLTNLDEFNCYTDPQNQNTDGDIENDGSEYNNGRDPITAGDGKDVTIDISVSGDDNIIDWTDVVNDDIDGPFYVYASQDDPFFSPDELIDTKTLADPSRTTTHTGGAAGPEIYYYKAWDISLTAGPPDVQFITPDNGPEAGGTALEIFGDNFVDGASVTVCGVQATGVTVESANKVTCTTPAGTGLCAVRVTNPNGQYGELAGAFQYNP